jgi:hypothetical protein
MATRIKRGDYAKIKGKGRFGGVMGWVSTANCSRGYCDVLVDEKASFGRHDSGLGMVIDVKKKHLRKM